MYTQVYNDEKDRDILVQLGDLRTVAGNFESVWHGVSIAVSSARPHVLGIVRQLQNDGREADAKKITKMYESALKASQRLLHEAVAILHSARPKFE
jgi:hypothetical protein